MLQRLYVHNFRCLVNFELKTKDMPSSIIIGRNGTGKSTITAAMEIFQQIGRGINQVEELVQTKDFAFNASDLPMRFEIEVLLSGSLYHYVLALELPENFKKLRVLEEHLYVTGAAAFNRQNAQVSVSRGMSENQDTAKFSLDWHLVALPIIQGRSAIDPINIFKVWLEHMIILSPVPSFWNPRWLKFWKMCP